MVEIERHKSSNSPCPPCHRPCVAQRRLREDPPWRVHAMEKLRFRHGELAVPQKAYLKWVKNQIDLESACLELPFTILLLLSFSAFAIFSLKQDTIFSVEHAISEDITHNANFAFSEYMGHKNFEDVHSYADFWSWLRLGFLPAVFQPAWTYSERRPQDVASVFDLNAVREPNATWQLNALGSGSKPVPTAAEYLHFNRVVGGLRFRQQVAASSSMGSCKFPSSNRGAFERWYGKSCMPNVQEIAYPPELADAEVFNDPTKLEWMLPALDSFERIVEQALDMEDGCSQLAAKNRSVCYCQSCDQWPWIREDVQRLEVSMITYNAHYGLLTYTGVHFWFLRGGRFHKRLELTSVFVNSAQPVAENTLASAFSLIWAVLLLWVFIAEVREIGQIVRNADTSWYRAILEEYIGFSNAVDWISFIIATVVAAIFVALAIQTAQLQATLRDLLLGAGNGREAYMELVKNFFAEYEATYSQESTYRLMLSAYPLMLILRLLKSFDAQPRLAVITETLREASQDMLHFSLALSAMVVCLCLDAVLLFGRDIEDLGNFWRAFHFAFRIIFSEDEEAFQKLEKVSRFTAYAWFTIFTVLLVIILLNMLLAIIMDNYMIVKKRAQSLESLPYQMSQMWRRWRMSRRKERVKLDEIWATFVEDAAYNRKAMCQSGRLISPSFLMDMVPGIPSSQAERTLVNSWMEHLKELEPPFQVNDAHQLLSGMEAMTRKIRNGLFFAFDVVHYFDSRPAFMMSQVRDDEEALAEFHRTAQQEVREEEEARAEFHRTAQEEEADNERSVVAFVEEQTARLSAHVADALAQSMEVLEKRQARIEEREESMSVAVRHMHGRLLQLQGDAKTVARRLEKALFIRQQIKKASHMRGSKAGRADARMAKFALWHPLHHLFITSDSCNCSHRLGE
ncbi:unnamed protein product [Durusdinium trenchii]|uniref:Polycystin cation channel PKD1/PKD2 domain-containing protein n=1 Tax=Durusdinium trenchii TaxID=1381693 RepID=A0ABP0MSY4_9DINO